MQKVIKRNKFEKPFKPPPIEKEIVDISEDQRNMIASFKYV